jgi:hypothetical protein
MGVRGQRHAPAALPPGTTRYPFVLNIRTGKHLVLYVYRKPKSIANTIYFLC